MTGKIPHCCPRVGTARPVLRKGLRGSAMKNHTMLFGLLIVTSLSANAFARDKVCCVDPNLQQIQVQCCQGTLLPYHVALKRADDATKAEAALAHMTQERNDLQAQLAKLQSDLKSAVAERDKARVDAAASDKNAKDSQDKAAAAEKAKEVAGAAAKKASDEQAKAKQEADAAKADLAKAKDDAAKQVAAAQDAAKMAADEKEKAVADAKKATDELAEVQKKLAAVLESDDKKKKAEEEKKKEDDAKKEEAQPEPKSEEATADASTGN